MSRRRTNPRSRGARPGWGLLTAALGLGLTIAGMCRAGESGSPPGDTLPKRAATHWAFQRLQPPTAPPHSGDTTVVDAWIDRRLQEVALTRNPKANRQVLIRRVAFLVTGLPPTPEEIDAFVRDTDPGAYDRMIERFLASPRFGERWAQHWLDAAGYADSNGYFNADTDRPLAYRYRDYTIRSLNRDKPFDRFVQEQIAGDELSGWEPGQPATPEIIELLEATHFLRNGQDGSGESDGNPDEVRVDRYYALESAQQILGTSLLGLTVQCAKCHDHKFEPLTQKDYYSLQAFLYPAFHVENWVKPNDRVVSAPLPGQREAWKAAEDRLDARDAAARRDFANWIRATRPTGQTLFADSYEEGTPVGTHWSNSAPGDDHPAGSPPVALDADTAPAARARNGSLELLEGGGSGDRWLSTRDRFVWAPEKMGAWIQVTFDLRDVRIGNSGSKAERIGYVIAAHDFDDSSPVSGGNLLIDGNPGGATSIHLDYPGPDSKSRGSIGGTGYQPGRNYGVRITRTGAHELTLEHLVDGVVDGSSLKLANEDLPPGGFAFEYCCGRSFVVDNVVVEASNEADADWTRRQEAYAKELAERRSTLDGILAATRKERVPEPGRIAWMTDVSATPPTVPLLRRGNPKTPGDSVGAEFPEFLKVISGASAPTALPSGSRTTGRRLALARWITTPGSPQAALLARVTVNRIWQQYFGTGIVATPDNLGLSGAPPTNPELLEWLASEFVESGWSLKALHRAILRSATFRQSSEPRPDGVARDPSNHRLWRFPLHRLDAEAARDAMLVASGRLGSKAAGPYVPTPRRGDGEVLPDDANPDALSRSLFLQHRRTQVPTLAATFDAPSVVFNCTRRATTTMPLQSLAVLNSDFAVSRGKDLAARLERDCGTDVEARVRRGFLLTCGREPNDSELDALLRFVAHQRIAYGSPVDAEPRVWADLAQSLFGLNAFLYLE